MSAPRREPEGTTTAVAAALAPFADTGLLVLPGFFAAADCRALDAECDQRLATGAFHPAAIGHGGGQRLDGGIRSDQVAWLEPAGAGPALTRYFECMEAVRADMNRSLYLGLNGFEAHFAHYPAGAFYRRHLDRFRDDDARTLTAVLYLNADWPADAGGQLRVESDDGALLVAPEAGTLVLFLSGRYWHEVLPATRSRRAISGWFLRRNAARCW